MKDFNFLLRNLARILCLGLISGLVLTSCDDDDDSVAPPVSDDNIVEIAAADSDFELLVAALTRVSAEGTTDLVTLLSDETQEFTVFAPTDDAFAAAGFSNQADIDAADVATLEAILTYHVLTGTNTSADLNSGAVTTVNGAEAFLSVSSNPLQIFINGNTEVTQADALASNGVIHVINQVLIPPSATITETAVAASMASSPEFANLVAALTRVSDNGGADLVGTLNDAAADFTVFAPTDEAFGNFLMNLGFASLDEVPVPLLEKILLYHVVPGRVFSTDLTDGATPATARDDAATVTIDLSGSTPAVVGLSSSDITATNTLATNGVIHTIDRVLFAPEDLGDITIAQVVAINDDFTLLNAAVGAIDAGLAGALSDPNSTLTVFAPNDDAFATTGLDAAALGGLTEAQATEIIGYHALTTEQASTDLMTGPVTTAAALDLFLSTDGGVFINPSNPNQNIQVIAADLQTANGIIHVIEQVILPPSFQFADSETGVPSAGTVTDAVINLASSEPGEYTQLLAAILKVDSDPATSAGLATTLSGAGPFTVFAPTDTAFQNLYTTLGVSGIEDIDATLLLQVLQYHVVSTAATDPVYSTGLSAGPVTMLDGNDITINLGDAVTITDLNSLTSDATVAPTDIVVANGVIHSISEVLVPSELN